MTQHITRRRFVQSTAAAATALGLSHWRLVEAQDDPLYQAAKKEGKLSLYWGSYEQKTAEEFRDAFKTQCTAIGFDGASLYVPHPMQNRTTAELHRFAEEVFETVLATIARRS